MHKIKPPQKNIEQKTKNNIIPFPNRNNTTNSTLSATQAKQSFSKADEDKDSNLLLIFEMLLVLKEQLDNLENELSRLSIR